MISVIIPTIRPERAKQCIAAIHKHTATEKGLYEIVTEEDAERVGCPIMVRQLTAQARYDNVMFLGDDTIPQPGFMKAAIEAMQQLPDGWGMVGLNDGFHDGNILATHWLASKKLLPALDGEFFHVGYRHCYCDQELMERCKKIGRYIWSEDALIWHRHPMLCDNVKSDSDYARVYSPEYYEHDRQLFESRKHLWA